MHHKTFYNLPSSILTVGVYMNEQINYKIGILTAALLSRLLGHLTKLIGYLFHFFFPKIRFTIPPYSPAKWGLAQAQKINNTIWQTNYTNKVTLPVYCNYLFNRLMSLNYHYRYVSTEERAAFIAQHADKRTARAYNKLTDGAAQADFWRLFVLYQQGGVYIDIDGQLVWKLSAIIKANDDEVLIIRRKQYTNFFLASKAGNAFLQDALHIIIDNIEQKRIDGGVFSLTGPTTLNQALINKTPNSRSDKITCAQGTFTNEYFQYIDKKRGKWTYAKNEDLLKKE